MKHDLNYSALIGKYFDGLFSEDELRWFKRKLVEDKDLAAEFQNNMIIDNAIKNEDIDTLRIQLDKMPENQAGVDNELRLLDNIDKAIKEEDVIELRDKLESIHNEVEYEIFKPDKINENDVLNHEIDKALIQSDIDGLRDNLANIHESISNRKKGKNNQPVFKLFTLEKTGLTPMRIASSLAVLITGAIITMFVLKGSSYVSNDMLLTEFESVRSMSGASRGSSQANILNEVNAHYNNMDYAGAIILFEELDINGNLDLKNKLYYAIACRETGDYAKAISLFKEIKNGKYSSNQQSSIWELGMTYLECEQNALAKEQFAILTEDKEAYKSKEAQIILNKIKLE